MKKRIVVDIDGTITGLDFLPIMNRLFQTNYAEDDVTEYEVSALFGIKDWEGLYDKIKEEWHTNCTLKDSSTREVMEKLHRDFEVFIISARPKDLYNLTKNWLERKEIPYQNLILTGSSSKKVSLLKEIGFDVLIEDHPKTTSVFPEKNIILMDAGYNRSVEGENIHRVFHWNEVMKFI